MQEISDLKLQLKNLKENLYQAENYPGQKGLEQVKYYQRLIDETEEELLTCGADLASDEENNRPWTDLDDDEKKQAIAMDGATPTDPLSENAAELLNINEKLNWLLQNKDTGALDPSDVLTQMQDLMRQRETLLKKRKLLKEDPSTSIMHYKRKKELSPLKQDKFAKDAAYVGILDEQLQAVYNEIFVLREQILKENNGEHIKTLGQKISALERKEKELKARLTALNQTPKPPRIIERGYQRTLSLSSKPADSYPAKLTLFLQQLKGKIHHLKLKISQAATGNEIAALGQQLTILNQQLAMTQTALGQCASHNKAGTSPPTSISTAQTAQLEALQKNATHSTVIHTKKRPSPIAAKIKKIQMQPLWSETPDLKEESSPNAEKPDIYNAEALSRNLKPTSRLEAEQAEALRSISKI